MEALSLIQALGNDGDLEEVMGEITRILLLAQYKIAHRQVKARNYYRT